MANVSAMLTLVIAVAGCACILRAVALLLWWRPAPGRIVYNGWDRMQRQRDGAWSRHRGPPIEGPVLDRVAFEDQSGQEVRADLRRRSGPYDNDPLLWHDPKRPERVTHRGPGYWLGAALLCLGTAAWLAWLG